MEGGWFQPRPQGQKESDEGKGKRENRVETTSVGVKRQRV